MNDRLIKEKRYAVLERAMKDKVYQRQLFEEYSISSFYYYIDPALFWLYLTNFIRINELIV